MKFQATVKVLSDVKSGISRNTGDEYKYQSMTIEFPDGEGTARMLTSLGTKEVEKVASLGIQRGSQVFVDLYCTTVTTFNKFVENRIYVRDIALAGKLPEVQVPNLN